MRIRELSPRLAIRRRREAWRSEPLRQQLETHRYSDGIYESLFHARLDPHFLVNQPLDAASVVVDVGAFVGYFAEAITDRTGATVYCFEANPSAARLIRSNLRTLPYLLGPVDRRATLALHGERSTVEISDLGYGEIEVEVRRAIDVFTELGLTHIDLLKVSAPGTEFDLIEHLVDEGWVERIDRLLVQFHAQSPGAVGRYKRLQRSLSTTHECTFRHAWVWEQWERKQ